MIAPIGNPPGYRFKKGHPFGAEQLDVDHGREALQVVAPPRQAGRTVLDVKKASRPTHPDPPSMHGSGNQITRPFRLGFGGVQLRRKVLIRSVFGVDAGGSGYAEIDR